MLQVYLNNKLLNTTEDTCVKTFKSSMCNLLGIQEKEFYLVQNGRRINDTDTLITDKVHIVLRLCGGKGGFGSMLRAIGAQIEKTTNREACRDLSGRRLRDINEEKRLKNWIAQQGDREKEAADRKQKKLERLCEKPKHEFKDECYDRERSELPEKVEDAVTQGMKAGATTHNNLKRKAGNDDKKKKKPKLWIDADVEDDLSSTDNSDDSDSEGKDKAISEVDVKKCSSEEVPNESNSKLEIVEVIESIEGHRAENLVN